MPKGRGSKKPKTPKGRPTAVQMRQIVHSLRLKKNSRKRSPEIGSLEEQLRDLEDLDALAKSLDGHAKD